MDLSTLVAPGFTPLSRAAGHSQSRGTGCGYGRFMAGFRSNIGANREYRRFWPRIRPPIVAMARCNPDRGYHLCGLGLCMPSLMDRRFGDRSASAGNL